MSDACPVCRSERTKNFFNQLQQPAQCGYLAPTRQGALAAPLADITLWHCLECGHIWNSSFNPDRVAFSDEYDLSQFYSPAYRKYASKTVARMVERYGLAGKTALEIACGKGDFLRMLLEGGVGQVIGFDPTYVDPGLTEDERKRVLVHKKFYDTSERGLRPELVVCRSALQYIPDPRAFVSMIRETLSDHHAAIVYFQTTNSGLAFRDKVVWYVMYEAGCFFTAGSVARLFRECGFQVLDIVPALDDSHFDVEVKPAAAPTPHPEEAPDRVREVTAQVDAFVAEYDRKLLYWSERFTRYQREGKRVAMWAAGMRAISLLSNCPAAAERVEAVVDVNVQRQGRFLPKTAQPVISPEGLAKLKPDVVLCTNPTYATEIRSQIEAAGLRCEFEVLH